LDQSQISTIKQIGLIHKKKRLISSNECLS